MKTCPQCKEPEKKFAGRAPVCNDCREQNAQAEPGLPTGDNGEYESLAGARVKALHTITPVKNPNSIDMFTTGDPILGEMKVASIVRVPGGFEITYLPGFTGNHKRITVYDSGISYTVPME